MATNKKIAPYGTWESPITIDTVAGGALDFNEVHVDVSIILGHSKSLVSPEQASPFLNIQVLNCSQSFHYFNLLMIS